MAKPALKPGRVTQVIRVTFCPGHPGQTRFKNYSGLDHVSRKIKKAQWRLPLQRSLREPRPLFETMILLAANAQGATPLISLVHMHATIVI